MILTVTGNVAIDRTYVIDHLEVGAVHKVSRAYAKTGGKGVNVSRCVQALGGETLVTGLIGRAALDEATRELTAAGLDSNLFAVDGEPRQTVTVTAQDGTTTAFDELGPTVTEKTWSDLTQHIEGLLKQADMVVIAGSLPPGSPEECLARLCKAANRHQVPVILDARGAAMRAAQNQAPLVAKLNRSELAQTLGRELTTDPEVIEGATELKTQGAQHVVVTLGPQGAIGVSDDVYRVTHPVAEGNPIGAGDAFSAALALALTRAHTLRAGAPRGRGSSPGKPEHADRRGARPERHAGGARDRGDTRGGANAMTTFILACDHRNSLRGWLGSLQVPATETDATARRLKNLCVEALIQARPRLNADEAPMLLLDEEYGVEAIPNAKANDLQVVIPAEQSGQAEFLFEHGDDFGRAIERVDPDAIKALVRYNPAGDAELNRRSRDATEDPAGLPAGQRPALHARGAGSADA